MSEKMVVRIDRDKWYTASTGNNPALLTPSGKRCCLGFVMQQEGFTDAELIDRGFPSDTMQSAARESFLVQVGGHYHSDTNWASAAATINDLSRLSDAEREEELHELCRREDSPIAGFEFHNEGG
jgi:hypothetical protein